MPALNFCEAKKGNENSYNAGDSINAIDWSLKSKNNDVFEYVKALIKMRKDHPAFRMTTAKQIAVNIKFMDNLPEQVIAYTIDGAAVKDKWSTVFVVFNGSNQERTFNLPFAKNTWLVHIDNDKVAGDKKLTGKVRLLPYSCNIFYQ